VIIVVIVVEGGIVKVMAMRAVATADCAAQRNIMMLGLRRAGTFGSLLVVALRLAVKCCRGCLLLLLLVACGDCWFLVLGSCCFAMFSSAMCKNYERPSRELWPILEMTATRTNHAEDRSQPVFHPSTQSLFFRPGREAEVLIMRPHSLPHQGFGFAPLFGGPDVGISKPARSGRCGKDDGGGS
jgi:hypothetical protein